MSKENNFGEKFNSQIIVRSVPKGYKQNMAILQQDALDKELISIVTDCSIRWKGIGSEEKDSILKGISYLLDNGANPNYSLEQGSKTALHLVFETDERDLVKMFLDKGANSDKKFKPQIIIKRVTKVFKRKVAIIQQDVLDKELISVVTNFSIRWKRIGSEEKDSILKRISYLLDNGANPNYSSEQDGKTALHFASETDEDDLVNMLLDKGADINRCYLYQGTALHCAADKGNVNVINLLISRGIDSSIKNLKGKTALISAAKSELKDIVNAIISATFRNRDDNVDSWQRMLGMDQIGDYDVQRCLDRTTINLLAGSNFAESQIRDRQDIFRYVSEGNARMVSYLTSIGLSPNLEDDVGMSLLSTAAQNNRDEIIDLLVQRGASVLRESRGISPLLRAAKNNSREAVNQIVISTVQYGSEDDWEKMCQQDQIGSSGVLRLLTSETINFLKAHNLVSPSVNPENLTPDFAGGLPIAIMVREDENPDNVPVVTGAVYSQLQTSDTHRTQTYSCNTDSRQQESSRFRFISRSRPTGRIVPTDGSVR